MTCACVRRDALDCYRVRYGLDLIELMSPDDPRLDDRDECCCVCHMDEDLDEEREWE